MLVNPIEETWFVQMDVAALHSAFKVTCCSAVQFGQSIAAFHSAFKITCGRLMQCIKRE